MITYFLEIKNRLTLLLINGFFTVFISYFYKEPLLFTIMQQNIFKISCNNEQPGIFYFIFTDVTEILSVYLKLIVFLNFQIVYAYSMYHIFIFIIPALFKLEYLYLKLVLKTISTVYLMSIILANCFLLTWTWNFFLSFQNLITNNSFYLHFEAKLIEYFSFYILFYSSCVLHCQLFTLLFLFLNYISITVGIIKKFRKLFYYFFLILSIFISPPEILIQIFLFLVILFIHECLILLFLIKINCS